VKPDRRQKDKGYQSLLANFAAGAPRLGPHCRAATARATISHHHAAFDFDDKPSEIG
jgi:hypothetical protein